MIGWFSIQTASKTQTRLEQLALLDILTHFDHSKTKPVRYSDPQLYLDVCSYLIFCENVWKMLIFLFRCSEFHPSATVGLVAGLSGTASLFQIDGKMNPKIQVP